MRWLQLQCTRPRHLIRVTITLSSLYCDTPCADTDGKHYFAARRAHRRYAAAGASSVAVAGAVTRPSLSVISTPARQALSARQPLPSPAHANHFQRCDRKNRLCGRQRFYSPLRTGYVMTSSLQAIPRPGNGIRRRINELSAAVSRYFIRRRAGPKEDDPISIKPRSLIRHLTVNRCVFVMIRWATVNTSDRKAISPEIVIPAS